MPLVVGTSACQVQPDVESVVKSNSTRVITDTYIHRWTPTRSHIHLFTQTPLSLHSHTCPHSRSCALIHTPCSYICTHTRSPAPIHIHISPVHALSHTSLLSCSRLQPGGTHGKGHVPLSPGPQSLCLAPAPEMSIEHVRNPCISSVFPHFSH